MADGEGRDAATDLARDLVAEMAPEELPLFPAAAEAFRADPGRALAAGRGRDEILGFGGGEAAAIFMTPVVLSVVTEVLKHVAIQLTDSATQEGGRGASALLRRLTHHKPAEPPAELPTLTAAQLAEVRAVVVRTAGAYRVPAARVEQLADGVVSRLALAGETSPPA